MDHSTIHIAILANQILGADKIGGFGSMTMQLGLALASENYKVTIITPIARGKSIIKYDSGITFIKTSWIAAVTSNLFKELKADIFHSQNQSLFTYIVQKKCPEAIHIVTCRDPRNFRDWITEFTHATFHRKLMIPFNFFSEEGIFLRMAIRKADVVTCPAFSLVPKIMGMYDLKKSPRVSPNIEDVPETIKKKDSHPTVCWVGRFANRKNLDRFLIMAERMPDIKFLVMGNSEEADQQKSFEKRMSILSNVEYLGFRDKFDDPSFFSIYERSSIFVNTAFREGLPLTFIEAVSRGCALVSALDPDNFVSRFGKVVEADNFEEAVLSLFKDNIWKYKGEEGHKYVMSYNGKNVATQWYINLYKEALDDKG